MQLLAGRVQVHDITDLEPFVCRVLHHRGVYRGHPEFEDAFAFLVEQIWALSLRWSPDKGKRFSASCGYIVGLRFNDWLRYQSRYYNGGDEVSLDAGEHPLGAAVAGGAGGNPADRVASLDGLFAQGDSETDRDLRILRRLARSAAR